MGENKRSRIGRCVITRTTGIWDCRVKKSKDRVADSTRWYLKVIKKIKIKTNSHPLKGDEMAGTLVCMLALPIFSLTQVVNHSNAHYTTGLQSIHAVPRAFFVVAREHQRVVFHPFARRLHARIRPRSALGHVTILRVHELREHCCKHQFWI